MTVKYEVSEGENWKRTLRVEVDQQQVKSKFDEIYKKLRADAKIPGFRPGKVPMSQVKSRFGDLAKQDVLDELLQESYSKVLEESGLDPISYPAIKDVTIDENEPFVYIAEIEIKPEFTLEKYSGFTLKHVSDKVSESEVDQMVDYIRHRQSELEVMDRPAEEGDIVFADLEIVSESSDENQEKEFKDVQIELRNEGVSEQFLSQLKGRSADDVAEIDINYPDDHFDKRFAGQTVKFKAGISAVKRLKLVELGEEFFKQFDDSIKDIEEFRSRIRADIVQRKKQEVNEQLRGEAIKAVVDKNRIDLPDSMLEVYLDRVVADFRKNSKEDIDEKAIRERYRPLGNRQLRWGMLFHEIARQEKIEAAQEDIDSWTQRFADNYNMSLDEARKRLVENRQVTDLKETIVEQKVLDYIIDNSTVEAIESAIVKPGDKESQGGLEAK